MTASGIAARGRVLIVEDHALFRAMLVQLINQQAGMTVCGEAANVQDALRLFDQAAPDVAVVDLLLKGSSGLDLIKHLRARDHPVPVLVLSMHAEGLLAQRVLHAGARGFISKDEPPEEVVAALRTVMAGRIYLSQRLKEAAQERLEPTEEATAPCGMHLLSDRELEVFLLVGHGLTSREMSVQLGLGSGTVDTHRARIKEKLGIRSATELYQRAARWVAQPCR